MHTIYVVKLKLKRHRKIVFELDTQEELREFYRQIAEDEIVVVRLSLAFAPSEFVCCTVDEKKF